MNASSYKQPVVLSHRQERMISEAASAAEAAALWWTFVLLGHDPRFLFLNWTGRRSAKNGFKRENIRAMDLFRQVMSLIVAQKLKQSSPLHIGVGYIGDDQPVASTILKDALIATGLDTFGSFDVYDIDLPAETQMDVTPEWVIVQHGASSDPKTIWSKQP